MFGKIKDTDMIFLTEVFDETGRRIEKWKVSKNDYSRVVKILNDKFGLGLKFKESEKVDRDLDWLK
jgi:molybdopterin-biosynthesis enzyme MoeA-like protein